LIVVKTQDRETVNSPLQGDFPKKGEQPSLDNNASYLVRFSHFRLAKWLRSAIQTL